ncbi:6-phosphogluconate dehydrogenase C-terminal domain-like protein [Annulohypoxylon maeteangense]|uniref:6-phosphogluconate dehydrogenase C-terminal domain-like protein n=1 Tax=Annulohypoxylon maeteangense TaxID=1927788 RepID=UPI0020075F2A|nr:6-phosphogluconate dehydrogenase C-terminal domain-like protein [Annulohypoxylon maeteangense]KAI0889126.1 6-phosphogluconate dehydrogenase C-terminal domain-like protein [Annulohypoxylon maeteangense]
MASPLAKIGIISIGDMGVGIAKLLIANRFSVATNIKGRSNDTLERAKAAQVELLDSDEALTQACSVILSVVPPRDAVATAQRIVDALTGPLRRDSSSPLYYADLNAVAPSSVKHIASLFTSNKQISSSVRFVDGCILGGPPALKPDTSEWYLPSLPTSGPHSLSSIPDYGPQLFSALNMKHISEDIGAASGLKMCFASMGKGFISLAIQSFTTAHRLGVLDTMKAELAAVLPMHLTMAEKGVVSMAPKAYRWAGEMEEIARTLQEEGGFEPDSFIGAAKVYRLVADDTVLGEEKIGKRKRGTTVEDMAVAVAEGLQSKKKKNE